MNKKLFWQIPLLLFLIIGTIYIARQEHNMPFHHNEGRIFGTIYHLTYQCDKDLQKEIEAELMKVDYSLSMFNDSSVISLINKGNGMIANTPEGKMFTDVFQLAMEVSRETNGAFDITVAPLVNAWGFGFKQGDMPTPEQIDSLRQFVGFEKLHMKTVGKQRCIDKDDPRTMLDCSAIAKGYGTDIVANYLRSRDVKNFMVEIGGEVVVDGKNEQGDLWRIGVNKPTEDPTSTNNDLQAVINLPMAGNNVKTKLKALATSGNYRNFYYKDGKRYAHTIDPRTGFPVQHNILSATVIAPSCAIADAYATSFMVMGLEETKKILASHPEIMAYLIYTDAQGNYAIWQSDGLKDFIKSN
ncbi:MAG: FAD:protein FMN transferase [Prevotella sp.]|nr:FAD:protein FMN transferase [Prevotella sp.]